MWFTGGHKYYSLPYLPLLNFIVKLLRGSIFFFSCLFKIQIFLDMGKPDDDEGDEEEDASFIVHCVPGCSLHIYDS